jgi:DNA repair exonuclease SbcCD ATPase subunit
MILKRLRVESLGCFYEPIELSFTDGINIISGNNETGKSTLIIALHHALFTPYSSQALEIKNLQPWGTELAPEVEVELWIDGILYRLDKRFLYEPICTLHEGKNGDWLKVADGDRADERIRSLLLAEKPGRGAAGAKNRGLARLLWLPQDEELSIEIDGALRNRVEACLGVATLDEMENRITEAILDRYTHFWTKTQKFTKGSGLPELESRINELEGECHELDRVIRQVEQYSWDLQQIQEQISLLTKEAEEIENEKDAQSDELERVALLRHNLEKAKEQLKSWEKAFELADDRRYRLKEAKEIQKQATERLELVNGQLETSEKATAALIEERIDLGEDLKKTLSSMEKVELELDQARRLNLVMYKLDELAEMENLWKMVDSLAKEIDSRRKDLAEMPSPTEKDVAKAQKLERTLERLAGKLESVGLSLSFKAYSPQSGMVERDSEGQESFTAQSEETISFKALRNARLVLDGVGEIDIRSGAEEVASLQAKLQEHESELHSLLAPFSASTSADLERLRLQKLQGQKELDELIDRMAELLGDRESPDTLRAEIATSEREVKSLCAKLTIKVDELALLDRIELEPLEQKQRDLRKRETTLRSEDNTLGTAIEKAKNTQAEYERKQIGLEAEIAGADRAVAELVRLAGSEQAVEDAYQTARREREAAREKVAELEATLPKPEDDPQALVERLSQELEEISETMKDLEYRGIRIRANIDTIAEQGTYEELVESQEKLESLKQEYMRKLREAKALRLLKGLLDARRQEMVAELTDPVSRRVTHYFQRVSGLVERQIRFDESLQPASINTPDIEGAVPGLLSTGAREQLYILTRLALGKYLAEEQGRMLFVFDDCLVNADQIRHQRFIQLLEEAGNELQILIMTCHGERYRGMREATYHAMS